MSMLSPSGSQDVGERVGAFADYESAQKAVTTLIEAEIPAREIAIIGSGVRTIERVTGKLGYATAVRAGAINGLLLGLLFAALLLMFDTEATGPLMLGVIVVGIGLSMMLSLISYTLVRRRRSYASTMQVTADHYEVFVQPTSLHRARAALGTAPGGHGRPAPVPAQPPAPAQSSQPHPHAAPQAPVAAPHQGDAAARASQQPQPSQPQADEPPRYGERVDPETLQQILAAREARYAGNASSAEADTPAPQTPRYGERAQTPRDEA